MSEPVKSSFDPYELAELRDEPKRRRRLDFIRTVERESIALRGRGPTADELERIIAHYPGD